MIVIQEVIVLLLMKASTPEEDPPDDKCGCMVQCDELYASGASYAGKKLKYIEMSVG